MKQKHWRQIACSTKRVFLTDSNLKCGERPSFFIRHVCMSVSTPRNICQSVPLYVYLCFICPYTRLSFYVCPSISSVNLLASLSVCVTVSCFLALALSVCLTVSFFHLSDNLSVCLSLSLCQLSLSARLTILYSVYLSFSVPACFLSFPGLSWYNNP